MDYAEQRRIALAMAIQANAPSTQAAIKDTSKCHRDILHAAANDIGVNGLVSHVLQGPPEWAYHTLVHVPGLGDHRDALLQKVAESPETALNTLRFVPNLGAHSEPLTRAAGNLAQSQGNISGFSLINQGGYVCWYTMYWTNNGENQPSTGTPDKSQWIWSGKLLLGQSETHKCTDFALPNSPLQAGNEVWMYVSVQAGSDMESPLHFVYDPNTTNTANFSCSGTTTSDHLGFNDITPS